MQEEKHADSESAEVIIRRPCGKNEGQEGKKTERYVKKGKRGVAGRGKRGVQGGTSVIQRVVKGDMRKGKDTNQR